MSKIADLAKVIGQTSEVFVEAHDADLGLFALSRNGAMVVVCAGKKAHIAEEAIPFMKMAILRLQEIVKQAEGGSIDILSPNTEGYVYKTKEGTFQTLEEWEDEQSGEKGFSS